MIFETYVELEDYCKTYEELKETYKQIKWLESIQKFFSKSDQRFIKKEIRRLTKDYNEKLSKLRRSNRAI